MGSEMCIRDSVSTLNDLIVPVFNNKRPKMAILNHDRNASKFTMTKSTSNLSV